MSQGATMKRAEAEFRSAEEKGKTAVDSLYT
jgi:hypothetical protein